MLTGSEPVLYTLPAFGDLNWDGWIQKHPALIGFDPLITDDTGKTTVQFFRSPLFVESLDHFLGMSVSPRNLVPPS